MYPPHRIKLPFKTEKKFPQQLQQKELVVEHVRFGVKSRHFAAQLSCPLYPQKQTLALHMSAKGHKRS